jgi:hypothetical protein
MGSIEVGNDQRGQIGGSTASASGQIAIKERTPHLGVGSMLA